jgi:YVTN family beta-propeller protein
MDSTDHRRSFGYRPAQACLGLLAALLLARGASAAASTEADGHYRVYATNEISGDLSVIEEPSHALLAVIRLGTRPRGVRVSPDGRLVYVALSGSPIAGPGVDESKLPPADRSADGIGVVDAVQRRLKRVLRGVTDPEQIVLSPNGRLLYLASQDGNEVLAMRPATGAIAWRHPVQFEPEGLGLSPDGKVLYVTEESANAVAVLDAATARPIATIEVGMRPRGVAFAADGSRAYISGESDASLAVIDARAHRLLRTLHVPGDGARPMGVALSHDGARIYVATGRGGTVVPFDARSLEPLTPVAVGARPWGVAVSPDDRYVYSANGQSDDVSVLDTQTLAVIARIKVGERPWGVAVGPVPEPPAAASGH